MYRFDCVSAILLLFYFNTDYGYILPLWWIYMKFCKMTGWYLKSRTCRSEYPVTLFVLVSGRNVFVFESTIVTKVVANIYPNSSAKWLHDSRFFSSFEQEQKQASRKLLKYLGYVLINRTSFKWPFLPLCSSISSVIQVYMSRIERACQYRMIACAWKQIIMQLLSNSFQQEIWSKCAGLHVHTWFWIYANNAFINCLLSFYASVKQSFDLCCYRIKRRAFMPGKWIFIYPQ